MHRADLSPTPRDNPLSSRMKRRANIPELFWKVSLDAIPDKLTHKQVVLDYISTMHESETKGLGIILVGRYGTGKSALGAILLMQAMLRSTARCYFVEASDIPGIAIEKPQTSSGESVWELLTGRAQFLVINDLGDGQRSNWSSNAFTRVINARHNALRPTYITTNLALRDEQPSFGLLDLIPRLGQLGGDAYQVIETDPRGKWRKGL